MSIVILRPEPSVTAPSPLLPFPPPVISPIAVVSPILILPPEPPLASTKMPCPVIPSTPPVAPTPCIETSPPFGQRRYRVCRGDGVSAANRDVAACRGMIASPVCPVTEPPVIVIEPHYQRCRMSLPSAIDDSAVAPVSELGINTAISHTCDGGSRDSDAARASAIITRTDAIASSRHGAAACIDSDTSRCPR